MEYGALRVMASALVLVGVGVGATSLGFHRWGRRDDIGRDVDALRAELDLVKQASRRIHGPQIRSQRYEPEPQMVQGSVAPSSSSAAPPTSAQPATIPVLTPEEADHRASVVIAANEKVLSDSYSIETRDPEWSSPAADTLRAAYQGEGFEGVTTEVDCRSTLCRVDFRYDEGANGEVNWRNIMHRMPWPGSGTATFNRETRTGSFFVAREGHEVPSVDANNLDY